MWRALGISKNWYASGSFLILVTGYIMFVEGITDWKSSDSIKFKKFFAIDLFFDDFNELGFERSLQFIQSVGDQFLNAYIPIVKKRMNHPFSQEQREFQLYRRGRYVEFNLLFDRGTLFGLQSGGRTESILMSLPPQVRWEYNWSPEENSLEKDLYDNYLKPRDWLR